MNEIYKNPELIDNIARQHNIDPVVFKINLEQAVNLYIDNPLSSLELRNQQGYEYANELLDIVNSQYQENYRSNTELSVLIKEINLTMDRLQNENPTLYKKELEQLEALKNTASALYSVSRKPELTTFKNKLVLIQANADLVKFSLSLPLNIKRVIIGLDGLIIANNRTIESAEMNEAQLKERLKASNAQLATVIGTIPATLAEMAAKNENIQIFYQKLQPATTALYNNLIDMPEQTTASYNQLRELLLLQNQLLLHMVEVCSNYYEIAKQGKSADSELSELNNIAQYIDQLNINTDPKMLFDQKNQCELSLLNISLDKIISELTSEIQKREALIIKHEGGYAAYEEREALNELKAMLETIHSIANEHRMNPARITTHSTRLLRQEVDIAFNNYMSNPLVRKNSNLSTIGHRMKAINDKIKPIIASPLETIYTEPPQRPAYPTQPAPQELEVTRDVVKTRLSQDVSSPEPIPPIPAPQSPPTAPRSVSSGPQKRPAPAITDVSRLAATTPPPPRPTSPAPPLPHGRTATTSSATVANLSTPVHSTANIAPPPPRPTSPAPPLPHSRTVPAAIITGSTTVRAGVKIPGTTGNIPPPLVLAPGAKSPTTIDISSIPPPTMTPSSPAVNRAETLPVVIAQEPIQAEHPLTRDELLNLNRQYNNEYGKLISQLRKENPELYKERIAILKACLKKGAEIKDSSIDEEFVNSQRNKLELIKLDCEIIAVGQLQYLTSSTRPDIQIVHALIASINLENPDRILLNREFLQQRDVCLSRIEEILAYKYLANSSAFSEQEMKVEALTKKEGNNASINFKNQLMAEAKTQQGQMAIDYESRTDLETSRNEFQEIDAISKNRQDLRFLQSRIYFYLDNIAQTYDAELATHSTATDKEAYVFKQSKLFEKLLPLLNLTNDPKRIQELIPKCELAILGLALQNIDKHLESALNALNSSKDPHRAEKIDLIVQYRSRFNNIQNNIDRLLINRTDISNDMLIAYYRNILHVKNDLREEELVQTHPNILQKLNSNIDSTLSSNLPFNFPVPVETLTHGTQAWVLSRPHAILETETTRYRGDLQGIIEEATIFKSTLEKEDANLYSEQIDALNEMIKTNTRKRKSAEVDTQFIRNQRNMLETIRLNYRILRVVGDEGKKDPNINYILGLSAGEYPVISKGIEARISTLLKGMAYSGINSPASLVPTFLFTINQERSNIDALYAAATPETVHPNYSKHRFELALLQHQLVTHMITTVEKYRKTLDKNKQAAEIPELKMLTPFVELLKTTGDDNLNTQKIHLCELALLQITLHQAIQKLDREIESLTTSRDPEKGAQKTVLEKLRASLTAEYNKIDYSLSPMLTMLTQSKPIQDQDIQTALTNSRSNIQGALEQFSQEKAMQKKPGTFKSILNTIVSLLNEVTPLNITRFKSPLERVETTLQPTLPELRPKGPTNISRS